MLDRKLRQDVYIRVCRDSGFTLDYVRASVIAAMMLKCSPLEIFFALPGLPVAEQIADGTHPAAQQRS